MVETYYYWKTPTGINWVGYSIAHNRKEEYIIEALIKKNIKKSKVKTLYKKVRKDKVLKKWNW